MKQPWKSIGVIITYVVAIITGFLSSSSPFMDTTLNTKKIDRNIGKLTQFSWFKNLYEDEEYRRLFFVNRKVRNYLQNPIRVHALIKGKQAQKRFHALLDKQRQLRNN
ncbi:hypothetical protein [Niallia taxi]|uniref:hypothetical protein n=1 Tax=Niallia taxi TaxID=2499688 RepID=UPI003D28BB96